MKIYNTENFIGGWFCGDFEPTVYRTKDFEVCYKQHTAGEVWDKHYHAVSTEINYLIRGEMRINDQDLHAPMVFVIEPMEVADPTFFTDVELIVIKVPSLPSDKIVVER
jgi:hypothetical protein